MQKIKFLPLDCLTLECHCNGKFAKAFVPLEANASTVFDEKNLFDQGIGLGVTANTLMLNHEELREPSGTSIRPSV